MNKIARKAGPARSNEFDDYADLEKPGFLGEYGAMIVGGVMLVVAFAFAGHYMGQNAVAHNAEPGDLIESASGPISNILAKGSLLISDARLGTVDQAEADPQTVSGSGKGDFVQPRRQIAKADSPVLIVPAAVNLDSEDQVTGARMALAPSPGKVEQVIRLKRSKAAKKPVDKGTQQAIAQRRVQMAEENCLARAVYFEARSESELGQLAVAKVILNRVKDPEYPKSICGVVYQGSGRRNSCQFSFACDGLPDDVKSPGAWSNAKRIAQKAISGDAQVSAIGTATNYHADYVRPKWAKSMKRLIKIGRHVFYEDS